MASLEVSIGADNSELNKKIAEAEKDLKELSRVKIEQIKLGLDTKEIDGNIKDVKKSLTDLKSVMKDTGQSFTAAQKPIGNAGNTLTNFSRIAQDAPFGIMGIGNNITATAEAFSALSRSSGGAGAALKAVGASLAGPGGILFAVSLVTTALTVMSQKGLTVSDVFNKLTGTFDQFKADLKEVNKEAAKNAAEQVASVGAYTSAAQDINLSMKDRLIAVKKLQDEYPAFFGNLTKEQILNGNVANAVKDVTEALKAKARAQAYAGKLGDLAAKEVDLREKEGPLLEQRNNALVERNRLEALYGDLSKTSSDRDRARLAAARGNFERLNDELKEVQDSIRANISEMDKWAAKSTIEVKASIKLDFKEEKLKKVKKLIETPQVDPVVITLPIAGIKIPPFNIEDELNKGVHHTKTGIFSSLTQDIEKSIAEFTNRLGSAYTTMSAEVMRFNEDLKGVIMSGASDTFSNLGTSIGEALAQGGNVISAVGASLIASLGGILSAIGDKLIALGVASLLASTVFSTFGTALGVGSALAAIAGGVALKAGGALLGSQSKGGSASGSKSPISAGNSVSSPTSSVVSGGSFSSGLQNVVFEISGQKLVGVLSNTLGKNVKLGGTAPAI